jgi:hypothetical protein
MRRAGQALPEGDWQGPCNHPRQPTVDGVDAADDLSDFLTSRRAKISPPQAGLRSYGRRQVPGLRRQEVASLAGVSVDYYKRLEPGNATGLSDSVLEALGPLRADLGTVGSAYSQPAESGLEAIPAGTAAAVPSNHRRRMLICAWRWRRSLLAGRGSGG